VALQRKSVKPIGFADAMESSPMPSNRERIAFREGASGVETLYMTGRMRIKRKNTRGSEPVRRFAQALN